MSKRFFDIIISFLILLMFLPILILISFIIVFFTQSSVLYVSKRIGKNKKIFMMPKFKTMIDATPDVATHLMKDPRKYYTKVGFFLRKYSLDEFPQFLSVIKGDMSLVGPRPALYNQYDLIEKREKNNINHLIPGITGLSQIKGRDNLSIDEKVEFDLEYLNKKSFMFDLKIFFITIYKVLKLKGIKL